MTTFLEKRELAEVCYAARSAIAAIRRGEHVELIELSRISERMTDVAAFIQASMAEELSKTRKGETE